MKFDAYYSDPHFEHNNIIKYCNRPFKNADEMTFEFISRYNKKISRNNNVLFLGDLFLNKRGEEIIQSMNGRKFLLRGNHDKRISDSEFLRYGFEEVYDGHFLSSLDEFKVRFSHYPYKGYSSDKRYDEERPPMEKDVILIHGHTHDKVKRTYMRTVHVGVDAWDYGPAMRSEVKDILKEISESTIRTYF